jgi:DNA-binding Lrp family transcriptional regulator
VDETETGSANFFGPAWIPEGIIDLIARRAADIVLAESRRPDWLTLAQAGRRLGCSPDAVRMRVKRGRLEGRRQGRRLYVSAESVERLG